MADDSKTPMGRPAQPVDTAGMSVGDSEVVRVLVVDDEPEVAAALAEQLSAQGCRVQIALGGKQALEMVPTFDPHCVLLDVRMPQPDGVETARLLRQRYGEGIVLVAVTGFVASPELAPELALMDHCLRKPVESAMLRKILPSS
jgi:two-component system response regulator AtoC